VCILHSLVTPSFLYYFFTIVPNAQLRICEFVPLCVCVCMEGHRLQVASEPVEGSRSVPTRVLWAATDSTRFVQSPCTANIKEINVFVLVYATVLLLDAHPFPKWVCGRWIWHGTVSPLSRREKGFKSVIFPFPPREKYSHAEVSTTWNLLHNSSRSEHQAGSLGSSLALQLASDHRHGLMESPFIRQLWTEDECVSASCSVSGTLG